MASNRDRALGIRDKGTIVAGPWWGSRPERVWQGRGRGEDQGRWPPYIAGLHGGRGRGWAAAEKSGRRALPYVLGTAMGGEAGMRRWLGVAHGGDRLERDEEEDVREEFGWMS